jgi:putative two-component system response regulator
MLSPSLTSSLAPIQAMLLQCLEDQEPSIYRHGCRVAQGAVRIGQLMGLPRESLRNLELAAGLHDLGKLMVPSFLVHKAVMFNREEYRVMQRHALLGARLLESHPETQPLLEVAMHHHEHWDGTGYPGRLAGDAIPLLAQITAVVDAHDAMTSDRFGGNRSHREAMEEILRFRGTQFSPGVVDAFLHAVSRGRIFIDT